MEKRNLEQRCAIKFCVKLNENATETYEKLRWAYWEHALSKTRIFRRHKAFLDGRESVEDELRCGKTLHVKNGRKCDQSEGSREVWSTFDSQNDLWCVEFESPNRLRLRKRVRRVRPEIADTWILHHDNAPCHTAISMKECLAKKGISVFRSHQTRLIWVRVTSSFSQNSNSTSKVVILELWTTSKR